MKTICIYHHNCADGFGAAWVVRKALGAGVQFHPGIYGEAPPDVAGKDVILVDFSYKYDVLVELSYKARSVIILDHHKSAAEDLGRLWKFHAGVEHDTRQEDGTVLLGWRSAFMHAEMQNCPRIAACFDMERSGAMLAWDHFFPGQEAPQLLKHIQDRDLWRFQFEGTREIQANLFSYPYDFEVWDRLMNLPALKMIEDGVAIERKHHKDVAELVAKTKRRMTIGGYDVPVANLPYTLTSDAGHLMAQDEPFAACYMDTTRNRYFSLRSTDAGLDVSEIAKLYGGGGHRNAAGFSVPFEHPLACNAPPLKCYQVGEQELVAAYTPEQAIAILCSFSGYASDDFTVEDVSAWTDAELDRPCFEEDGTTPADPWRKAFASCTYPQYLGGWE